MRIANYDEFIQVINSLFNPDEVSDFASFVSELAKSKKLRNIKRNRYETELKKLKSDVIIHKQKLRMAQNIADKQQYGKNLKELNRVRRELIRKHKQADTVNLFNEMSENTKIYACCRHLLTKYLPQALAEDLSRAAEINPDGSVSVNPQTFKDSGLYRDAAHIKDYVASYFENYPERIKGTRYFVGLHKKSPTLNDLLKDIDSYFEKLNSPSEKESNNIKKSHIGIEVIKVYPQQHLQVVRLLNKAALNYEGSAMHHCVGSYASRVEKGETQIYSLRNIGNANQELIPHATVEITDGKIKQIKGYKDSVIAFQYISTTRDMLLRLIKSNDFQDIIKDENIPAFDKNNIGIFKDTTGKIHDLFNFKELSAVFEAITITKEALTALPLHKMQINNLTYKGLITENDLTKLLSLQGVKELHFSSLEYEGKVFDYSAIALTEVCLNMQAPNLKKIILPPNTKFFSLKGNFDNLESLMFSPSVKSMSLEGCFPKLKSISDNIKRLSLDGEFPVLNNIPDKVISLDIRGKFPNLKYMNTNVLTDLSVESNDIVSNLDISRLPKLKNLSLYGECIVGLKKLPQAPTLETLHIGSGNDNYELGKQYCELESNFTASYPHLQSITLNGTFPRIEELDLSLNHELIGLETLGAKFENLKKIKFPDSLSTCLFDFAFFPKLKELDYSNVNGKCFGKIEEFSITTFRFGHNVKPHHFSIPIKGISLSFAHFNCLETLKFPVIAEDIKLSNLSGVSNVKNFNFNKLTKLKNLNLSLVPFAKEIPQLNFSLCNKLTSICIDGNILNNTILPPNVKDLSIISLGMDKEMPYVSLDKETYKKLKTLECVGFLPDERLLKPSVENLILHVNNHKFDNLTRIDVGSYKYVDLQMSGSSLSKLQEIIFPQTFKKMYLGDTTDIFTTLDFSNTIGEVRIHQKGGFLDVDSANSYLIYVRNGIVQEKDNIGHKFDNFLMLSNEQMQNIKHIKLGNDITSFCIYKDMPVSPDLTIEIAHNMPVKTLNKICRKNPHIKFVREKNIEENMMNINELCCKCRN